MPLTHPARFFDTASTDATGRDQSRAASSMSIGTLRSSAPLRRHVQMLIIRHDGVTSGRWRPVSRRQKSAWTLSRRAWRSSFFPVRSSRPRIARGELAADSPRGRPDDCEADACGVFFMEGPGPLRTEAWLCPAALERDSATAASPARCAPREIPGIHSAPVVLLGVTSTGRSHRLPRENGWFLRSIGPAYV